MQHTSRNTQKLMPRRHSRRRKHQTRVIQERDLARSPRINPATIVIPELGLSITDLKRLSTAQPRAVMPTRLGPDPHARIQRLLTRIPLRINTLTTELSRLPNVRILVREREQERNTANRTIPPNRRRHHRRIRRRRRNQPKLKKYVLGNINGSQTKPLQD